MSEVKSLLRRIDRMLITVEQQQKPRPIFKCYWGNKPIPIEDQADIIITKWTTTGLSVRN